MTYEANTEPSLHTYKIHSNFSSKKRLANYHRCFYFQDKGPLYSRKTLIQNVNLVDQEKATHLSSTDASRNFCISSRSFVNIAVAN